jgi:hypothetical protein
MAFRPGHSQSSRYLYDEPLAAVLEREKDTMVQTRIKPHFQQAAEAARRREQIRVYRRNVVFGLLLVAAAILIVSLLRTNPSWIFPPGWWRP